MHYELIPGEATDVAIRRILLEGIASVAGDLTNDALNRDEAIHAARKTFKRLRAALRLVRPVLGDTAYKKENTTLRDTSRLLSPLRDSAVLIEMLDIIATRHDDLPAKDVAAVRAWLVARYDAVSERLLGSSDTIALVLDQLDRARIRIANYPLEASGFDALAGVQKIYAEGDAAMTEACRSEQDSHLYHEWRKQIKYLWHAYEIMLPVWPQLYGYLAEELHVLSTHLGDGHDAAVLRDLLINEPLQHGNTDFQAALTNALTAYEGERYAQARPLGMRLYVDAPDGFTARLRTAWDVWESTDSATLLESHYEWLSTQLVGTAEAAALLAQPVVQVRRMLRDGRLPAVKLGGTWLIPRAALHQLQPK